MYDIGTGLYEASTLDDSYKEQNRLKEDKFPYEPKYIVGSFDLNTLKFQKGKSNGK